MFEPFEGSAGAVLQEGDFARATMLSEKLRSTKERLFAALAREPAGRKFRTEVFMISSAELSFLDRLPHKEGVLAFIRDVMVDEEDVTFSEEPTIREIVRETFGYEDVRAIALTVLVLEGSARSANAITTGELRLRLHSMKLPG